MQHFKSVKQILVLLLFVYSGTLLSQTKLASFFSDNMVLQRNENVSIWGNDEPNVYIKVVGSWGKEANTKTDEKGKWELKIETLDAGGPYTLKITGSKKIIRHNVLIGEVWLCSGQSNMWVPLKGYENTPINRSNEAILNSKNNKIRFFSAKRIASLKPLDDVSGEWKISDPSTVANFSALAYFFGNKLNTVLDIPIGLIHTSWGGSKIEAWLDEQTLSEFEDIKIPDKVPEKGKNQSPSLLYNSMFHPFAPFSIKGFIWYQGESNVYQANRYQKLFPTMIKSWRKKWKQDSIPFYFVQIAPYGYGEYGVINSAFLREVQLKTMQTVDNTGMVVTLDIGDCKDIHPREKEIIGNRLAYWALVKNYGIEGIAFSGPIYKSMENSLDGKIKIYFDFASNGLSSFGNELNGFKIAGKDKVFHHAKVKINDDKTLSVWSEQVKTPIAVRYAFDNCTEGSLFNTEGLPASSFRTDDWDK